MAKALQSRPDLTRGLLSSWRFKARHSQIAPDGDWRIWFACTGRGTGKTRSATSWGHEQAAANPGLAGFMAARTLGDLTKALINHPESGILATQDPDNPCELTSRNREPCIQWRNGAHAWLYSSERPESGRGPEHAWGIGDEVATWERTKGESGNTLLTNLRLGLRGGLDPRMVLVSTPRAVDVVRKLIEQGMSTDPRVVLTRGVMRDNAENLTQGFMEDIEAEYKGTRLFRQEALGELLLDVADAILTQAKLDSLRVAEAPEMAEILIGVDPALSHGPKSDKTGINVSGRGLADGHLYSIENASCRLSPNGWGHRVVSLVHKYNESGLLGKNAANVRVVAENNVGGELITTVLHGIDASVRVKGKPSRGKKHVRAEPILAYYERDEAHIVGQQPELEDQMTMVTPSGYQGGHSPDDMDSHVIGATELMPIHATTSWAEMAAANA